MLPEELVEEVLSQAQSAAKRSWEYGTVFEALLEYHHPSFSVFNDPFPDGKLPALDEGDVAALKYVKSFIITDGDQLCEGNGISFHIMYCFLSRSPLAFHVFFQQVGGCTM